MLWIGFGLLEIEESALIHVTIMMKNMKYIVEEIRKVRHENENTICKMEK